MTRSLALLALFGSSMLACRQDMHDQQKVEPLEASTLFANGQGSRQPVAGTIARGQLNDDPLRFRGLAADGKFTNTFPDKVTRATLERGRERYNIFCSPCHGERGDGRGMIVRRGFKQPSSFHVDRLRQIEHGYLFDVISNGFGQMSDYASQVPVSDRWAIVAWVRALQLSQNVPVAQLTAEEMARVAADPAVVPAGKVEP